MLNKIKLMTIARRIRYFFYPTSNLSRYKKNISISRLTKIFRFNKQKYLLVEREKKIIFVSLNSINKFNKLETCEQKKHKKKQGGKPNYLFFLARH
jgi:hypothetical protein